MRDQDQCDGQAIRALSQFNRSAECDLRWSGAFLDDQVFSRRVIRHSIGFATRRLAVHERQLAAYLRPRPRERGWALACERTNGLHPTEMGAQRWLRASCLRASAKRP